MTDEQKNLIDSMEYREMLKRWRFGGLNDDLFAGDTGKYYSERMGMLAKNMPAVIRSQISKDIGWG